VLKNRFKIITLGCKVNQYDSAFLKNLLIINGFFYNDKNPDLIIVNSCSVTKSAIAKTRRAINSARKKQPQAKIFLIGCWPKVYGEGNLFSGADYVLSSREEKDILKAIIKKNSFIFKSDGFLNTINERSRYFIKIQEGCNQFCSYCIIPFARGPLKSRSKNDIIKEVKMATESGFEEIVLSGIHLGLYSHNKDDLCSLISEMLKIKKIGRIRLSSIEIRDINDRLIKLLSDKRICNHLHIPLQSGSDKILKLMNRPYDKDFFIKKINKIREKNSDISLTTDVIVGFPGEDKRSFMETYSLLKNLKFSKIHVFSFSSHEKTLAHKLPGKVSQEEIKERSSLLRQLSSKMESSYKNNILEKQNSLNVLVESFNGKFFRTKSEYYFDLEIKKDKILNTEIAKKYCSKSIIGKIIKIKTKNI
jgi:threonylcarbamoyladenosine tRNA methylthiotransferase MtaB